MTVLLEYLNFGEILRHCLVWLLFQVRVGKPFIICCADGYIIDCYGPFPANDNDSKILNYIIETDEDLQRILLQNKTIFLIDRGIFSF